jgi:hypothetical protein
MNRFALKPLDNGVTAGPTGEESEGDLALLPQKVNRVCGSRRRLFALSVNNPPEGAGWLARLERGDVISPKIGPGLL